MPPAQRTKVTAASPTHSAQESLLITKPTVLGMNTNESDHSIKESPSKATSNNLDDFAARLDKLANPNASRSKQANAGSSKNATHPSSLVRRMPPPHLRQQVIRRLDSGGARAIRSAQVVLDTSSIVKELLENALDAGATRVDIRLRGKAGLDSIAVSDNGRGISENDYDSVCRPGATSKIRDYADLESLTSLGFRGEALSAICELAKSVSITTRTSADANAKTLKYGRDGSLLSTEPAARPVGTTVVVEELFVNLPVRRKDALKNHNRETSRCVAMTQGLALISVHTRVELKIANDVKLLSRTDVVERKPEPDPDEYTKSLDLDALRTVTGNLLGRKTAAGLLKLFSSDVTAERAKDHDSATGSVPMAESLRYGCEGLVSNASLDANGSGGRARSSHQYLYVNRRPVDLRKLIRSVNDLYRRVTGCKGTSPVLVLNISLPFARHDFNLAPDKREVVIQEEPALIHGVVSLLESIWAPKKASRIPIQSASSAMMRNLQPSLNAAQDEVEFSPTEGVGPGADGVMTVDARAAVGSPSSTANSTATTVKNKAADVSSASHAKNRATSRRVYCENTETENLLKEDSRNDKTAVPTRTTNVNEQKEMGVFSDIPRVDRTLVQEAPSEKDSLKELAEGVKGPESRENRAKMLTLLTPSKRNLTDFITRKREQAQESKRVKHISSKHIASRRPSGTHLQPIITACGPMKEKGSLPEPSDACTDQPAEKANTGLSAKTRSIRIDWDSMCKSQRTSVELKTEERVRDAEMSQSCDWFRKSSLADEAGLDGSKENQRAAEGEMSRLFRQDYFLGLNVIGQFNKGFIICSLGNELFIIDQHASDEKYNFEQLQRNTVISKQKLLRPLALEFSAEDELLVQQHLDAFRAGGFGIEYRARNRPTRRLYLHHQPVSKHTMFVQDDLQEMVAMLKTSLQHASDMKVGLLRPPRVRAMFASRACRKSVMIGTSLTKTQMEGIVRNLGSMEHPWTCPHGRPTMRHLCTLPNVQLRKQEVIL